MALTLVSVLASFVCIFQYFNSNASQVYLWYPFLRAVTFLGIFVSQTLCKLTGIVSSGIIFNTLLIHVAAGLPEAYAWLDRLLGGQQFDEIQSGYRCVLFALFYGATFLQLIIQFWADPRDHVKEKVPLEEGVYCPELESSYFSRLILWWFNRIPIIGSKQDLKMEDLFAANEEMKSDHLAGLFESYWKPKLDSYNEKKRKLLMEGTTTKLLNGDAKNGQANGQVYNISKPTSKKEAAVTQPSVIFTLFCMFKFEFLAAAGVKAMADVLQFANPFLLSRLIQFVSASEGYLWQGVGYALLMFVASEIRSLMVNWYFYIMFRMGAKIQASLTGAVYRKTLRLSSAARRDRTVGEIVNVMAIDCDRFQMITSQIQQYWSSPFQVTLALIFLFNTLGVSAMTGVIIMVIFLPLSIYSSVLSRKFMTKQMKLKDQRTKMISEILNGIKVIKLYAWEVPMIESIEATRKKELKCILYSGFIRLVVDAFNFASPFLVALGSFATYTLTSSDNVLTPQIAFVSLTLFNQLRSPMTMIGLLINMTVGAIVSNKRIKDLLTAEEIDSNAVSRTNDEKPEVISIEDGEFSWDIQPGADPTLTDINVKAKKGQLIAVVGKVGAGKSSLLSALLGEMEKLKGIVGVNGKVAYVPQQAWIQNMNLQDNITFGRPYSKYYYSRVIDACALKSDLEMLPQGDSTEIGEKASYLLEFRKIFKAWFCGVPNTNRYPTVRGINLSGGQKARVSLARAVYQNSDVYLLDDPLSAVDSHVGKHIFEKVIGPNGLLRNKTRILVTHGVTFLKDADLVINIEDGQIIEMGNYYELMALNGHLTKLIAEFQKGHDAQSTSSVDTTLAKTGRTVDEIGDFDDSHLSIAEDDLDNSVGLDRQMSTISALYRRNIGTVTSRIRKRISESENNEKLIKSENLETGRVKSVVYWVYIKAASIAFSSLFIGGFFLFSALQLVRSLWLSAWSDDNDVILRDPNATILPLEVRLGVYAGIGVLETVCYTLAVCSLLFGALKASKNLHSPVLTRILHAPMSFFDTTPIGRILNRFGKDVDVVDIMLPMNCRYFLLTISQVATTFVAISISTPIFVAVVIPLTIVYLYALKFYVPTSRQLKRLESNNRSPIYSHFSESIQGVSTIRAFDKTNDFILVNNNLVDTHLRVKNLSFVANRWLGIRLELIGNCITFSAALFAALSFEWGFVRSAGLVGVSVSYALNITEVLNFAVRQISELETNIVSVERLKEYSEVDTEAPWINEDNRPPKGWPDTGRVVFKDYATRYRPGLDLVIKNINANIDTTQKIGIVGRTGAGKSSLTLALFRMIEAVEGQIEIDKIRISDIGLHDLRSNITIIPQDPVLFSGTLRFNLDPFQMYADEQLWRALELAHLKAFASSLNDGLEHQITEGGDNISVGQRQLVCLARALLRRSKILVLDEATAAVDLATDSLIQETIRREFADSTVLTIAHRLNTIMDYDRVMVLDRGEIKEFDAPHTLLADKSSIFYNMVADANIGQQSSS
uniref:Multidrug resistance-associated protein n=1 Tax=Bursaphelenchus xylophilus TaxID=6326 RepID=A0A8T9JBK5_BURXY|nr:multidrug resistance-associated protein [Bursaphelenchus xylophilus]